jgi:CdvA-like coiled-coil domain
MKNMGLNDLTLEKLISEINGYKEKMRAIHEDYGRASQDLQDRINVLGYTLNEHLKETKDQMATTPQRLLNLETKYVTGDISENEYRAQRQEFKGLLEKNLHSIEEIKSMIDVLSHIETKPLSPGEFKQTYPNAVTEWSRPPAAPVQQSIPALTSAVQAPRVFTPTVFNPTSFTPSPAPAPAPVEETVEAIAPPSTPTPPFPSNNGNSSTPPETSNAVVAPAPVEIATSAPVETANPEPTATPMETPLEPSIVEASATPDLSTATAPSQDVVEDIAEALVVKVVDDAPIIEASAAVAATETAQITAPVPGTESIPSVQPSVDLSSVGLAPPSQFYKVVCPKCGADVPKPAKVWELKGGKSKKNVLIGLFQCQDCRVKFREALTREIV